MNQFDVYSQFKKAVENKSLKMVASITEQVLPYKAQFVADPFIIFHKGVYHIFCEVFVRSGDKRISHLKSENGWNNWVWVADVITGLDLSFPAVYHPAKSSGEVVLIPQISKTNSVVAYGYNLERPPEARVLWRIDLGRPTYDLIIIKNPVSSKTYLVYCSRTGSGIRRLTGLFVSEIIRPFDEDAEPALGSPLKITGKSPWQLLLKALKLPRLAFRPAGNVVRCNEDFFTLPIQAKKKGMYGEMIAFVSVSWSNFSVKETTFFNPKEISDGIERFHHLSWTTADNGEVIFCNDLIQNGHGENWEIAVHQIVNP
ncbi:MAG: hypothetical protein ACOCXV_02340 [Bacteroidota bacterium]